MNLELICNNLKTLRKMNRLSQDKLAGQIHITRSTYSAYEAGDKPPDLQTIDALAAYYKISLDSLLNHDLSSGVFHKIYFQKGNRDMADLLNDFQSLSIPAKTYIFQRLDLLFQHESSIYFDYNAKSI